MLAPRKNVVPALLASACTSRRTLSKPSRNCTCYCIVTWATFSRGCGGFAARAPAGGIRRREEAGGRRSCGAHAPTRLVPFNWRAFERPRLRAHARLRFAAPKRERGCAQSSLAGAVRFQLSGSCDIGQSGSTLLPLLRLMFIAANLAQYGSQFDHALVGFPSALV